MIQKNHPSQLLPVLIAGAVNGSLIVFISVSFASLVFASNVPGHLGNGIGLILLGAAILNIVISLMSSYEGLIVCPQDNPAAVSGIMAAAIVAQMPDAPERSVYITIVAAVMLSTLVTGAVMFLLGRYRLGNIVRFIPYPVIGGFLAGTGWLLLIGGIGVMTPEPLRLDNLAAFARPNILIEWLPGTVFAIVLYIIMRRISHRLTLPGMLVLGVILFYAALVVTGTSIESATANGWFIGPFPEGSLWQPLLPADLQNVNWAAVTQQFGNILTIMLVSVISLLLNAGGLELATHKDIEMNRELKAAGSANLLQGIFGGLTGYHVLSFTILGYRMGLQTRLIGIIVAILPLVMLLAGGGLVALVPRAVVGGLVSMLGISFLYEWVIESMARLRRAEYGIILLILAIVITVGYLEAVAVGLVAAVLLFVIDYSHLKIIRHTFTGDCRLSRMARTEAQRELLLREGHQSYILELDGYIFFGTAYGILQFVRDRIAEMSELRFLVIDFRRVDGIDSSAGLSFLRIRQLMANRGGYLALTELSAETERLLRQAQVIEDGNPALMVFPDLDLALEWQENRLIEAQGLQESAPAPLFERLSHTMGLAPNGAERLLRYLKCETIPAGTIIAREGEPATDVIFVESGLVVAQIETGGQKRRIRTATAGTVLGELAAYSATIRSATLMAAEPSVIYCLSNTALQQMRAEDPAMSAAVLDYLGRLIAERLADTTRALEAALQ